MKVLTMLAALLAVAALSSCCSVVALFDGGPRMMERVTEPYELFTEEAYKVGVGDFLEISILSEDAQGMPIAPENFKRTVAVLNDGTISYLYNDVTGEVMAVGKSAGEIARVLQRQLVDKNKLYLGARVAVIVVSSASVAFHVAGEVRNPGPYRLTRPTTLTQAIIGAGWFTEFADRKHIQVIRREGDREIRFTFNYNDWERRPGRTRYNDIMLRPNDTVLVPD